jgi:hypothetical protein
MIDVIFKLTRFSFRRVNIYIRTNRAEANNGNGAATYPDHGNALITMWDYVVKDEAMGEHPEPVFELQVYTIVRCGRSPGTFCQDAPPPVRQGVYIIRYAIIAITSLLL